MLIRIEITHMTDGLSRMRLIQSGSGTTKLQMIMIQVEVHS